MRGIEGASTEENIESNERNISSLRLRTALKVSCVINNIRGITVHGEENLDLIPPGSKPIFVCSHVTDGDLLVAAKVAAEKFDLLITSQSTNFSNPMMSASFSLAGRENFVPIEFKLNKDAHLGRIPLFNSQDYKLMKESMDSGKATLFAAHNPTYGSLPDNGGVGAIYLSQLTPDSVIIPIGVDLHSKDGHVMNAETPVKNVLKGFKADVNIGVPFKLDKIDGIEQLDSILAEKPSAETNKTVSSIFKKIREQSGILMSKMAGLLPKEKRGKWEPDIAG